MKLLAVGVGIVLLAVVLIGAGNARGPVADAGNIVLAPVNNSGITGTAAITQGSEMYIFVRATNLVSGATYGVALMTANCAALRQRLNPIEADLAGDGSGTSQIAGPNDGWWLGILATNAAVVACGPTISPNPGGSDARPTSPPPTGGGTVVSVATPTLVPTQLPSSTPHPPGS